MYVISGKTVDDNWVYASSFDGPGYSVGFNDAIKFKTLEEASAYYEANKRIYQNLKDRGIRKIIFKKKVAM